jgi:hypothetical protein
MPILESDIQILASRVMDDVPEGGGPATGTQLVDGSSNNVFSDISQLDRVQGRVSLRKVFVAVNTPNTDGYYGAHVIVAQPPADDNVGVVLFSTGDPFDERVAAASRIESYLAQGPSYPGLLFGNHIAGQMTVSLIQRESVAVSVVGDTLLLRKFDNPATEQYVRVTDVSSTVQTFTDAQGEFVRRVVVLSISDPLELDLPGFDATRNDASVNYTTKTKIYGTVVADASRYYGTSPVAVEGTLGDFEIEVEDIFAQLVPTGQVETPIADARMNQQVDALAAAGAGVSVSLTLAFTITQSLFVGGGILPGSLTVVRGSVTLTDDGGKLLNNGASVGAIDYENGILSLSTNVFGTSGGTHVVSYVPAAQPLVVTESIGLDVTQASQRLTWVVTLNPVPTKASLQLSYRTQGRWYVLSEDGSGALRGGDSSAGAGTLNYQTGTVSATLGALPDVGSKVILSWASSAAVQTLAVEPAAPLSASRFRLVINLGHPVKPGTLQLAWNDGTAKTSADNASTGNLTGDAAGVVFYASGRIDFSPNVLPAPGTQITVTTTEVTAASLDIASLTDSGANWTGSLGGAVAPGTVELSVVCEFAVRQYPGVDVAKQQLLRVADNGSGVLYVVNVGGNLSVGTVNYSTGAISLAKTTAGFVSVQSVWEGWSPGAGYSVYGTKLTGTESRTLPLSIVNISPAALALPGWAWWTGAQTTVVRARVGRADATNAPVVVPFDHVFMPGSALSYYPWSGQQAYRSA